MRNEEAIKIRLEVLNKTLQEYKDDKFIVKYLQPQIKLLEWVLEME